jgi:hypothetical protein
LHRWFKVHRHDLADDGFTENLVRRLPPRAPLLPQLALAAGLAALFAAGLALANLEGLASGVLRTADTLASTAADAIPTATQWLSATVAAILAAVLHCAASLRDLPLLMAVAVALYLAAIAGVAVMADLVNNE